MHMHANKISRNGSRCVCLRLRKASRVVSQFYDRCLQPAGIRGTQYAMLMHIAHFKYIAVTELGEMLAMDQSTATRAVNILCKMGLISRIPPSRDARKKVLTLTDIGTEKLREAQPMWAQAQSKMERIIEMSNIDILFDLLDQATEIQK